jgi:hypothetical protein
VVLSKANFKLTQAVLVSFEEEDYLDSNLYLKLNHQVQVRELRRSTFLSEDKKLLTIVNVKKRKLWWF